MQLFRYKQVDVVRVPAHALDVWRLSNKAKCTSDAFMPRFAPNMCKGFLGKTHFGHALKLRLDGGRTLFNDGITPIQIQNDVEGTEDRLIQEAGVLASVYGSGLWDDAEAMQALMEADNDDAEVELGEDEVQAQGRVETAIQTLTAAKEPVNAENVMKTMQQSGLRSYSPEHTLNFIHFRLSMTPAVAKCFRALVFLTVNGRVIVSPLDYEAAATLDARCQWTGEGGRDSPP